MGYVPRRDMLRSISIIVAALAVAATPLVAQESALTLAEVYETARERNPMLHAARASADAVAAQQPSAALPPDPEVQIGFMNASLPGLRADMPGSMFPSVQAMQMVPFPGKLRLSSRIAGQSTAIARTGADEAWWEVREAAAMAFYEVYQADRQIVVMEETLEWLRQFDEVATAMYSVGSGRQSDVLRAGVAVARMRADIARMRAMRTSAVARLNAVLDRPAETPVHAVMLAPLPREVPTADVLQAWADEDRPLLEAGRVGVEQARSRMALARRELWPDLAVGVQYGQRPGEMGTERMGSLMLGFSVPVFAGQRQLQMRREAAAMEQMASAELAASRANVNARIGELLADLGRTRALVEIFRTEVLPQAEANVLSAFSSYRVGRVDFMTLLDAQMTVNEYRQELHVMLAEYGRTVAELEMAVGRELPVSIETIREEP
jgi:outer membrane protein, heavy metal efflux system